MAALRPCRRPQVSQCLEWHKEVKPMSVTCTSDRQLDKVSVACTEEMHRTNEARKTMRSADGA